MTTFSFPRSLTGPYGQVFALTGSAYALTAFLARLPYAMSQLGILLLVTASTGSYAAGGLAAGAFALTNAVVSPLVATVADRLGQRRVVLAGVLAGAIALVLLVLLARTGVPAAGLTVAAAATGAAMPPVGPLGRVRWRPLAATRFGDERDRARVVGTAFAYEGAADEASFVLGPVLVGTVAALLAPAYALLAAAGLLAVFGTAFALHPSAPAATAQPRPGPRSRRITPGLPALVLGQLAIGLVFGATATGATLLTMAAGRPGLVGVLLGCLGVGSVFAGLASGLLPDRLAPHTRVRVFAVALLVLSVPLLAVDALGPLAVTFGVLGLAAGPYLISISTLAERIVPAAGLGRTMAVLSAATAVGYAIGSGLAGRAADLGAVTLVFTVAVAGGVLAVLAGFGVSRARRGTRI